MSRSDIIERERAQGQIADFRHVANTFVSNYILHMSDGQRLEMLRQLDNKYCKGCGSVKINCDCEEEPVVDLTAIRRELEDLRCWKKEALTVETWWKKVQSYMQTENKNCIAANNISDVVLTRLKALDALLNHIKPHTYFRRAIHIHPGTDE